MTRILGLALYGPKAASNRIRLGQYVNGLAASGISLEIQSLLNNEYLERSFSKQYPSVGSVAAQFLSRIRVLLASKKYDGVIVHCELLPFFPAWLERILLPTPYMYDFDDAFFLKYRSGRYKILSPFLGEKTDSIVRRASIVTAGSRVLYDYASSLNGASYWLPSVVDTSIYRPLDSNTRSSVFTVGWIGSPSTSSYLSQLVTPLIRLSKLRAIRFVVVGGDAPNIPGVEVVQFPWSQEDEIKLLHSFDVGVMPLTDDPWSRGKCAFKLIQYMACGISVVASPVGANTDVVLPECGFLAKDDNDWFSALHELCFKPDLRTKMGLAGRDRVLSDFSLRKTLPLMRDLLVRLAE
jgi:glycosyltransferase involved in cell wall biosynthesis